MQCKILKVLERNLELNRVHFEEWEIKVEKFINFSLYSRAEHEKMEKHRNDKKKPKFRVFESVLLSRFHFKYVPCNLVKNVTVWSIGIGENVKSHCEERSPFLRWLTCAVGLRGQEINEEAVRYLGTSLTAKYSYQAVWIQKNCRHRPANKTISVNQIVQSYLGKTINTTRMVLQLQIESCCRTCQIKS